ncbi:MAG: DUF6702 family protein [Bacteroidota bacterium]
MLKIENRTSFRTIITATVKCLFFGLFILSVAGFHSKKHPFFLSVIDIKQDVKIHTLSISVKMFTSDIEEALKKTTAKSVDLLNPKNKTEIDTELMGYIKKRLSIDVNGLKKNLEFIGYEREEDAIWVYLEIKKAFPVTKLNIHTTLLYDYLPQQTNIVHAEINDLKKSGKVVNPDSKIEFNF